MSLAAQRISQYRTPLMGFAILWIAIFHASINLPPGFAELKRLGFAGVDIFFFLSGFGLMYGWLSKKNQYLPFLKRRLIRIVPAYWLVIFVYWLLAFLFTDESVITLFAMLFGLDFFLLERGSYWFISSIILCYLLFPLYAKFYINYPNKLFLLISFTLVCLIASAAIVNSKYSYLLIFIERIPNFLIGIYVAERFINAKPDYLPRHFITQLLIVSIMLTSIFWFFHNVPKIILQEYGLYWYPLIIMTFPFICILVTGWEKWQQVAAESKSKIFYTVNQVLTFIGHHSLELYLTHILVYRIFANLSDKLTLPDFIQIINIGRVPEYFIYLIISLIGAVILKKIIDWLMQLKIRSTPAA